MTDLTHILSRSIIAVSGEDAVHFLQGILTQDVAKLAEEKIQFAALLSPQGKILHDMFLVQDGERILIDTPAAYKSILFKRLTMYKLRAKVSLADVSSEMQVYTSETEGLADPRHSQLPRRVYASTAHDTFSAEMYRSRSLLLGVPDSAIDFAPDEVVAADAGYDLLHAISYTKGCYVGQEVVARMHYKNIARKGFYVLESDMAPTRLAVLRFEDVERTGGIVVVQDISYRARLPEWFAPKLAKFMASKQN